MVIEWAGQVEEAMEAATLCVSLSDEGPETRRVTISGTEASVLAALRQRLSALDLD